jgi:hypothetical protein
MGSVRCPFYKSGQEKPAANAPCKFQSHPTRDHVSYCAVCGEWMDLRFIGWRPYSLVWLVLVFGTVFILLNRFSNEGNFEIPDSPQQQESSTPRF